MLLRPRQKAFLDRTFDALSENDNTLGIAPTGAGKTIIFSHLLGQLIRDEPDKKALVIVHRDELTTQNSTRFHEINPDITTSIVNAVTKDWSGQVVFGMVQTVSRKLNLAQIPHLDFLLIDDGINLADSMITDVSKITIKKEYEQDMSKVDMGSFSENVLIP